MGLSQQVAFKYFTIEKTYGHILMRNQRLMRNHFLFTIIIVPHEIFFQWSYEALRYDYRKIASLFQNELQHCTAISIPY